MKRPDFTPDQENWLCEALDNWYLCWKSKMTDNSVMFGIYSEGCNGSKFFTTNFEQYLDSGNVTHWMHLPDAPK